MNYSALTAAELIHTLETAGQAPPLDLIRTFLERQAELTPALLDLFRESINDDWPDEEDPRWYRLIHAAHLMLAYREEAALPIFEELYRQGVIYWSGLKRNPPFTAPLPSQPSSASYTWTHRVSTTTAAL